MKRKIPSGRRSKSKEALLASGDLTAATRAAYEWSWAEFEAWCAKSGRPKKPGDSDRSRIAFAEQIVDFLHDEYRREVSISTLSIRRAAIAWKLRGELSLKKWRNHRLHPRAKRPALNSANLDIVKEFLLGIKKDIAATPKQADRLYPEQVEAACAVAERPRRGEHRKGFETVEEARVRGIEDKAILSLLFYGVMRRSEVSDLRWRAVRSIVFEGRPLVEIVVARAKNNQTGSKIDRRRIPDPAASHIDALRALRDPQPDDHLFPSSKRPGEGLSGDRINVRMKEALAAAGIRGHSAHSGRVGMATLMAERGFSDIQIATAGGWRSMGTVKRYTEGRSETTMPVVDLVRSLNS